MRRLARDWLTLFLQTEELWLQTRKRSNAELRLLFELERAQERVNRRLRTAEMQLAYYRTKVHVPGLRVPSRASLAFRDLNFGLTKRVTYTRADVQRFWNKIWQRWRRRKILLIPPHKLFWNFLRDAQLIFIFTMALLRAEAEPQ